MSRTSSSTTTVDFNLPDDVLAVIPTDPYDQLDLARKITSMAIASRVSNLESESSKLKQKLHEKDGAVCELQDRVTQLEYALHSSESKLQLLLDDNMKLTKERDSLAVTAKKLGRDLTKLEMFKRQLMQSLNDENSSPTETVDIGTCDQPIPKAYPGIGNGNNGVHEVSGKTGLSYSMTPSYITPRLTPSATPKVISTSVSPRNYSAAGSPQRTSGVTSPNKYHYGTNVLTPWYPSSQRSSAANSPPRTRSMPGRAPRIDGKEFFRQARSRLSYEQFSAFLANIKELNAQKQSREETLRKAEEIFGLDNKDLYVSFQGLLSSRAH
ncbi:hypothetical protein ACFE04_023930 [Oxalis oulophora]